MTELTALMLPILLSAVAVFIASSILHTALPWHRNDFATMPNETSVREALRPFSIPPGDYMVPRPADSQELKSPEFREKWRVGPNMVVTVFPNAGWNMGRNLVMWFIYCIVVSLFGGYIASRALPPGAEYLEVFRFVGTTAFAGYVLALWQAWIWYRKSTTTTIKTTIDGLIFALLTAGVFGWLWPT
jgi:hypothetical protein